MLIQFNVKDVTDLPDPPTPKWALYVPDRARYHKNFMLYRTKGHAKSALKRLRSSESQTAQAFEWVNNSWVERDITQ